MADETIQEMALSFRDEDSRIPIRWCAGVPDGRSAGSLSQFIREYLCRHEGRCTRDELLRAIRAEPDLLARLERGQGLPRLLMNMRYSGFIAIEGEAVTATARTLKRMLVLKQS